MRTCGWPAKLRWKRLGVARLEPVVELLADRARELVDDLLGVDEVERADALLRQARRLEEQREVGLDLARRVGPLHLDDDRRPFGSVARCTCPIEAAASGFSSNSRKSRSIDWPSSSWIDALDVLERERADVVLQPAQLGDDVRRDDVGPGREQLAELDERRPELVEHLAQVPRASGRRGGRAAASARQQVGQLCRSSVPSRRPRSARRRRWRLETVADASARTGDLAATSSRPRPEAALGGLAPSAAGASRAPRDGADGVARRDLDDLGVVEPVAGWMRASSSVLAAWYSRGRRTRARP